MALYAQDPAVHEYPALHIDLGHSGGQDQNSILIKKVLKIITDVRGNKLYMHNRNATSKLQLQMKILHKCTRGRPTVLLG